MKTENWKKVRLGDFVKIRTGKLDANASSDDGKYPFFTCSIEPLKISTYSYDCECVLVAGNGDLNVKYYNGKFDAYQRTYIIESLNKNILDVKFLYIFLSLYIETLRKLSIGGVIKYIKLANLTEALIPLPSLEIQKKISKTIKKSEKIIEENKQLLEKYDLLIKSRFIEMFGNNPTENKKWKIETLGSHLITIDNGKSFVCSDSMRKGEYPAILKLSAVTYGEYNQNENKALLDEDMFLKKVEVKQGDLLFTRKNTPELVGMAAYVFETERNLMMPDLIFRLNVKDDLNKIYLWKLINHPVFRERIQNLANGSAKSMSNISKERLQALKIPVPPLSLQNDFASFVQQIDKSKFTVQKSLEKAETLYKSLMQEHFA